MIALVVVSAMAFGGTIAPAKQEGKLRSDVNAPAAKNNSLNRVAPATNTTTAIWTNDFSVPASWTISPEVGTSNWVIGTQGPSGMYSIAPIASATASTGFAMFDSDLLCTGNQVANLTTTNSVDCSSNAQVRLTFSQYYRRYFDSTFVFISNNGTTWTKFPVNASYVNNQYSGGSTMVGVNPHSVSVDISSVAANQGTVWVRFQFYSPSTLGVNAGCGYAWMIDDVKLEEPAANDVELSVAGFPSPYASMPILQVTPLTMKARVRNNGGSVSNNISVAFEIYDSQFNSVYVATSNTVASLNPGDTTAFLTASATYLPTDTGIYYVQYIAITSDPDANSSNDTTYQFVYVDDSTYARDATYLTSSYFRGGFGFNGVTGTLGQMYHVVQASQFTSATFYLANAIIGTHVSADVYSVASGLPGSIIGTSGSYTVTAQDTGGAFVTLGFQSPINVMAGDYFLGLAQLDTTNMTLGSSNEIYTPNTAFFKTTGAWATVESATFQITFMLRVNNPSSTLVGINPIEAAKNLIVYPNPSRGLINISNNGAIDKNVTVTILNNLGQTVATKFFNTFGNERMDIGNQPDGIYNIQITSAAGTFTKTIVISNK